VSPRIKTAATRPERNVSAAMEKIADERPKRSAMRPADQEVQAVIAFIKGTWPDRKRAYRAELSRREQTK